MRKEKHKKKSFFTKSLNYFYKFLNVAIKMIFLSKIRMPRLLKYFGPKKDTKTEKFWRQNKKKKYIKQEGIIVLQIKFSK